MTAKQIVEVFRADGHVNVWVNDNARIAVSYDRYGVNVRVNWDGISNDPLQALSVAADLTAAAILALEVERILKGQL